MEQADAAASKVAIMGRTVQTFTWLNHEYEARWRKFREALRKEDQEVLDELFQAPKLHLAACAYAMNPIPFENMLMAMLVEEHKKIKAMQVAISQISQATEERTRSGNVGEDSEGK